MNIDEIIEFLEDNDMSDIEKLKDDEDYCVLNLYYDFDSDVLEAARAYANEESDMDEESDEWYRDWYYPYLNDIAKDECEEILEDLNDEFEVSSEIKLVNNDVGTDEYVKVICAICNDNFNGELEELLNDYV